MNRTYTKKHRNPSLRCGSVLLMVLVAIVLMTLTTSTYLLLMRNEHLAARYSGNHLQTERLVQSGVEYLRVLLTQTPAEIEQQGGLLNNPDFFQDVLVIDDELSNRRGRFTIVAPDMSQGYYLNLRYGLENESAKLNLNSLVQDNADNEKPSSPGGETVSPRDRLLVIPGMNESTADAILDWLDKDDSPGTNGAESDYYLSLTPPYQPRNGPISHLDELLMIQGVTPELLYGVDANRNYLVDANELPSGALEQLDNSNGELNRGWSAYLTVHSLEKNVQAEGEPKIDLNSESLQTLHTELQTAVGAAEANFIIAYRQYGPEGGGGSSDSGSSESGNGDSGSSESGSSGIGSSGSGGSTSGEGINAASWQPDFEKEAETPIASLLDLINAKVRIEGEKNAPAQVIESPWKDDPSAYRQGFSDLLDVATVDPGERVAGRININLASRPVLLTLPGMTETLADQILSRRDPAVDLSSGDQRHAIWILAEGLITLEELKPMMAYLTTGGDVYSGQVIGYFDSGTARARAEVLLDRSDTLNSSGKPTRILSWHNLSPLGPGFSRAVLSTVLEETE